MRLFADSGGWIALFDGDDRYHAAARDGLTALTGQTIHVLTSDYVLDETLTFLQRHAGHEAAVACGRWLLAAEWVEVLHVDAGVWQAAWELFANRQDKYWSFTDCTSFVLMEAHELRRAFAFDRHFRQAGFELWPP